MRIRYGPRTIITRQLDQPQDSIEGPSRSPSATTACGSTIVPAGQGVRGGDRGQRQAGPRIMPNGMIAGSGDTEIEGGERQVANSLDRRAFKQARGAGAPEDGANTIKVMAPTIRRQQAMDLRGIELVPEQ